MIEAYAFFVMFTVQILVVSVLYPAWFIKYVRARAQSFPAERFEQLYPGVDRSRSVESFATRYHALNTGIAVLGLPLLGWLFGYMGRPDWVDGPVETLATLYFAIQMLPLGLVAWIGIRHNKALRHVLLESKRKAVLERRGLFDFISPFSVFLAVLGYFLFVAFVLYIRRHPFPGFAGLINIGGITLIYALNAFVVYTMLYGKKSSPIETYRSRVHTIGLTVKMSVYSCILCVAFVSLNFTLVLLDLQRWEPFAQSVFFVTAMLLCFMGLIAPPRSPEADGLGSSPAA